MAYSASEATSLDGLVAEALARNPEINVYSSEIAAAKGERRTAGEMAEPGSFNRRRRENHP